MNSENILFGTGICFLVAGCSTIEKVSGDLRVISENAVKTSENFKDAAPVVFDGLKEIGLYTLAGIGCFGAAIYIAMKKRRK